MYGQEHIAQEDAEKPKKEPTFIASRYSSREGTVCPEFDSGPAMKSKLFCCPSTSRIQNFETKDTHT
jgi:hypothetical protein